MNYEKAYFELLDQYATLENKFIEQIRLNEKIMAQYEIAVSLLTDTHNKFNSKQIDIKPKLKYEDSAYYRNMHMGEETK